MPEKILPEYLLDDCPEWMRTEWESVYHCLTREVSRINERFHGAMLTPEMIYTLRSMLLGCFRDAPSLSDLRCSQHPDSPPLLVTEGKVDQMGVVNVDICDFCAREWMGE